MKDKRSIIKKKKREKGEGENHFPKTISQETRFMFQKNKNSMQVNIVVKNHVTGTKYQPTQRKTEGKIMNFITQSTKIHARENFDMSINLNREQRPNKQITVKSTNKRR